MDCESIMTTEFKRLTEIDKSDIMELMNHPLVRRHLPLASGRFDESDCEDFVAAKERLWNEAGYGPWAFVVDGRFVGWGGLQPENGEADLGLVLHPDHWGLGRPLYREIVRRGFGEMGVEAITVLLPPTRKRIKGLLRLGFRNDGRLNVSGVPFVRYRLERAAIGCG